MMLTSTSKESQRMIITVGDPHFKKTNSLQTGELHTKTVELVLKLKPDAICIMGDILHKHDVLDLSPYHRAMSWLRDLRNAVTEYGGTLLVIIGNHDRLNNKDFMTDIHPFFPLKEWSNTVVADSSVVWRDILLVPYVEPGRFAEAIEGKLDDNTRLVLAHQEFRGAKMGAIASTIGDVWMHDMPLCVSGHIHDYHQLLPNMIYVGIPYQEGLSAIKRTISIFTESSPKVWTEKRVDLRICAKTTLRGNVDVIQEFCSTRSQQEWPQRIIVEDTPDNISLFEKGLLFKSITKYVDEYKKKPIIATHFTPVHFQHVNIIELIGKRILEINDPKLTETWNSLQ